MLNHSNPKTLNSNHPGTKNTLNGSAVLPMPLAVLYTLEKTIPEMFQALQIIKHMEDLPNKIRNAMGIICDVQLHDKKGKKFISIKVNPYSVPVSLRGRYYYRSGSTKMELTGIELNAFLLKKAGKTWDDMIEEGAGVKDIDEKSIDKFIEDSREKGRLPSTKELSTFQILEKLQLTDGIKCTSRVIT